MITSFEHSITKVEHWQKIYDSESCESVQTVQTFINLNEL